MIDVLTMKAPLAAGMDREKATELLLLYMGPHTYRGLVIDYKWTKEAYVEWVISSVSREIFGRG